MAMTGRALAIVNQKGGVGKTTTAVNLAASFALSGRATLLVDLDPQGNASSACGVVDADRQIYHALIGECSLEDAACATELERLHLVPSGPDLVGAEIELVTLDNRERRFETALARTLDHYEFVVVDCPPSLSLLTLNALTACTGILIPMQCEYYALEGLARLWETVERVRSSLNPRLAVEGILLTMVDHRNNLSRQVEAEVRSHFGDRVYQTRIPRNVRLSEAPSHGKPIALYAAASAGARAYAKLADEILGRVEARNPSVVPPALERTSPSKPVMPADSGTAVIGGSHGGDA